MKGILPKGEVRISIPQARFRKLLETEGEVSLKDWKKILRKKKEIEDAICELKNVLSIVERCALKRCFTK